MGPINDMTEFERYVTHLKTIYASILIVCNRYDMGSLLENQTKKSEQFNQLEC